MIEGVVFGLCVWVEGLDLFGVVVCDGVVYIV